MSTEKREHDWPLRLGTREDFARVREAFRLASFDDATVCRVLKIKDMSDLGAVDPLKTDITSLISKADLSDVSGQLAFFIRAFLFLEFVAREEVTRLFDRQTIYSFLALDVLRIEASESDEARYYTPAFIYPVGGFVVASDLYRNRDNSTFAPPPDVVFPAIYSGTLRFLQVISKSPVRDAIDLCAGSGIGALALSRHVERAVSSDITERASHFALFNKMLNDCENVEVVCGDLYEPVKGRTFDRIVAHPPYMPALKSAVIWRDGGETGETLTRNIVAGLPEYLRPGGFFYTLCIGLDTKDAPFEERARGWLGESASEFDVIFAAGQEQKPAQVAKNIAFRNKSYGNEEVAELTGAFESAGATSVVYGALVIHRRAEVEAEPLTIRAGFTSATDGADFEWAIKWHHWRKQPRFSERLLQSRPRLAPHLHVTIKHTVEDGELLPKDFVIETDKPFLAATRIDGWIVPLIAEFNGQRTPVEIHAMAREAEAMPDDFQLEDFAPLLTLLVERGYLMLDDLALSDEESEAG
ncbi:MAG: class I SAM-dependent methyltransferase [Pyrinomonadaceae bacterium]